MKIYHNPRCGKSRQTLALIRENDIEPDIIEYLKTPPNASELEKMISQLGIAPHDLIRKGEAVYKEKYKGKNLSDKEWIKAMVDHPILIERPIVIKGSRAIVGRPPENVISLFD